VNSFQIHHTTRRVAVDSRRLKAAADIMSDNKLILHPIDPMASLPSVSAVRIRLSEIGLIGPPIEYYGKTHYLQGPRFEALVPFAHSHRSVVLTSIDPTFFTPRITDSRSIVSIEICQPTDAIEFLGAGNVESPCCPSCDFEIKDWAALVSTWCNNKCTYQWTCPGCQRSWRPWHLDWRGTNGFGRFAIAFWNVHQSEAIPSQELLEVVHEVCGTPWTFFYYRL